MADVAVPPSTDSRPPVNAAAPGAKRSLWPSIGYGALAIVLAGLMTDGAAETVLQGSPLRWIVLGATVAALLLMAVLYRRFSSGPAAALGLLSSLAILALIAWLPGGVDSGVTVLGQPTPRVLSSVCAIALLYAVGLFARAKVLSGVMRWMLGGLAAYAAAAFIQGALLLVPYDQILHGQSLLRWLPRWLQGAFLGSLIAFPAAIVLELVRGLSPPRRLGRTALHFGAWSLMAVLAFAGLTSPIGPGLRGRGDARTNSTAAFPTPQLAPIQSPGTLQASENQGQPAPLTAAEQAQARADYQAAVAKLKTAIDYAMIDIGARQAKIGTDAQAISSYVQDQIRYEVYSGALRGARGTLLARAGNSVDRALLQTALLKAAGHNTRFAIGKLSAAQAEGLIRAAFKPPSPVGPNSPESEISDRAFGHFVLLGNALYDSGFKAPTDGAGTWARTVRDAQQHVWVQFEKGGQWLDADSSPGVPFGRVLVQPDRVMDALDPSFFDTVEFAVDLETIQDGKRATRRLLEQRALAADLAGVVVGFFHEKGSQSATPILLIGDQTFKGTPFKIPNEGLGGDIARSIGSLFETSISTASGVTGEWLNLRTGGPAGERSARYVIVDTTGQAARAAGQGPADPAVAEKQVSAALDGVLGIMVETGRLPAALLAALMVDMPDPTTPQGLTHILTVQSASEAVVRAKIPSTFFSSSPASYIDSPTVVISRAQPAPLPTAQDSTSIDLPLKGYRTIRLPEDPLLAGGLFYDGVAAGVIDHMTERWLLGADLAGESVGALFETALDQGVPLRVVNKGDHAPLDYLSPDARLRLSAALDGGQLALIPEARPSGWSAPLGWWNIDPSTGWTEDTTELGGHAAFLDVPGEAALNRTVLLRAYQSFCRVGRATAAATMMVIALANPDEGIGTGTWSVADGALLVEFVCAAMGDPVKGGASSGPRVPKAPSRRLPLDRNLPPRPNTPDVPPGWWSNRGTWRRWR